MKSYLRSTSFSLYILPCVPDSNSLAELTFCAFSVPEAQTGCQVPGVLLQVPDGGVGSLPQTFWQRFCITPGGG